MLDMASDIHIHTNKQIPPSLDNEDLFKLSEYVLSEGSRSSGFQCESRPCQTSLTGLRAAHAEIANCANNIL